MHSFEFDLDVDEQMAVSRRLGSRMVRPVSRFLMFVVMFVVGAGLMMASFGLAFISLQFIGWEDFAFFLALPLFFLCWGKVGVRVCQAFMRRVTNAQDHQGERVDVTVSDAGVTWATPGARTELEWRAVEAVYDEREAVMFRTGGLCYYIPSRLFSSPAARADLIEMCRSALGPVALKRSHL